MLAEPLQSKTKWTRTWTIWRMNLTVVSGSTSSVAQYHRTAATVHETHLFCRCIESICAWAKGRRLLGSPIARSILEIHISIRDLPRVPLKKVAIKDLVNRWADAGKWDSDLRVKAISLLREKYGIQEDKEEDKQIMGSSEGECYCEAGLNTYL
jgi:hypothetical protein